MQTVKEMVNNLGTIKYVALTLRVSTRTVDYWISHNQIGRESRIDFLTMLKKAGYKNVTLKQLNDLQITKAKKGGVK